MKKRTILLFMSALLTFAVLFWGVDQVWAQAAESNQEQKGTELKTNKVLKYRGGRLTTAERKAAANRARQLGLQPGAAGLTTEAPTPGGADAGSPKGGQK